MTSLPPRCYQPTANPAAWPAEALVCAVTSEPGAKLAAAGLVKILRAFAALSSVDGILQRELPPDLAALATGPALGSEAAAELLARTELAAADAKRLDEIAAAQKVDVSKLATVEAKRAALVARVPVAGAEVAPWEVLAVSEPALADAVLAEIGKRVDADPAYLVDYVGAVKTVLAGTKLVDAGAVRGALSVEEVML